MSRRRDYYVTHPDTALCAFAYCGAGRLRSLLAVPRGHDADCENGVPGEF